MAEEIKKISAKERARRKRLSIQKKKEHLERVKAAQRAYYDKKRAEKELLQPKEEPVKEKPKPKKKEPKKRGPKKKRGRKPTIIKKKRGYAPKPPYIFKIISCRNGKQNKFIGKYRTIEEAYEKFNDLKMDDRRVIFPSIVANDESIRNAVDEYVIIQKSDAENSVLRNEYGKLVEQRSGVEGWIILDKYRYKKEETFWVWGYDNRSDRKTFTWIYRNVINAGLGSPLEFKRILTFKNKVVIKEDDGSLDIVFCKTESEAVRFYNQAQTWARREKNKQLIFIGDYSELGPKRRKIEDEIMLLTGWPRKKVQMKTCHYYKK